ncbi:polysaccharide biosynthesis protein [Sphingomonas sp. FW199]|uniref:polysaccharide biosynthesis protein n=1 Tax=Sphingomonas sp. FW199 TaxID=3400217 RepID=UPI003CFB80F7
MWAVLGSLALALPIFGMFGVYRPVFRHAEISTSNQVLVASLVYALAYFAIFTAWSLPGVPRTVGIIQPVLLFVFMVLARWGARSLLNTLLGRGEGAAVRQRVLIYGAGQSGRQLAAAIANRPDMRVVGFVDDNKGLHGATVSGIRVFSPDRVLETVRKYNVDEVLLAVPSASQARRNEILSMLRALQLRIQTLPDIVDLALGNVPDGSITNLDINDLLGRDVVAPATAVITAHLAGHVILVTGAGGSIGSELCRQIIAAQPATLLLLDNSEFALYEIHRELELSLDAQAKDRAKTQIIPLLGSVQNEQRVSEIIDCWRPSHVYHAAAYKHVPLVEHNPIQGVVNNVFGTLNVARIAIQYKVRHFVLVSTDKAVRPTNVMGATKRLAEMSLQALADEKPETCLSMVRFGNVLGSSGSVVPVFRKQIMAGGPVTITDERITRFFMTIPEAAQLVIQAGAMASGGEVFVLDMGEPVRIVDLARNMIELSGLTVRDAQNPFGDIELKFIGLRPGEKLYEELLIGDAPLGTAHPRIRKAMENFLPAATLRMGLTELEQAIRQRDAAAVRRILQETVSEYAPSSSLVDHIFIERQQRSVTTDPALAGSHDVPPAAKIEHPHKAAAMVNGEGVGFGR